MTNPTDTKQQYEGAILQQLIKNSERLVVVEKDITQMKTSITKVNNDLSQMKTSITKINNDITQMNQELVGVKEITQKIETAIGWLKWIGGGVAAILLSVIANFVYSFIN